MQKKEIITSNDYQFHLSSWKSDDEFDVILLSIHGYNDYSNSFKIPGEYLSKFGIKLIAYDLRGFGSNKDFGEWYPLETHLKDINYILKKISNKYPQKKIFLLGESMGGAIALSYAYLNKKALLEGLILVSPAFWNFSKLNPIKSTLLNHLSYLLPNLRLSGKGLISVRPSDNLLMLEEYSNDPKVVKKPNLKSLNGIVKLMDKSYKYAENYFLNPNFKTLVLVPLIDEIVPRKPLINIINNNLDKQILNEKIFFGVYERNFHMILRDIDGLRIIYEIKEWIDNHENIKEFYSFKNSIKILQNADFYHTMDKNFF